jgi:3-oxoacyl-[acyl-carrier protein] reductase
MALSHRVALVTGGASPLGAAVAKLLAARGARVVVSYCRAAGPAEQVVADIRAAGGEAIPAQADVRDEQDVARLVDTTDLCFGPIEVLVSCTTEDRPCPGLLEVARDELLGRVQSELAGALNITRAVARGMVAQRRGRIVYLASGVGARPVPGLLAAATGKGALLTFARYVAAELAPHGITANVVAPGAIAGDTAADESSTPRAARMPPGRAATFEDIARVVAFFADDDSSVVTGSVLAADGGMSLT